jgi:hypothetical protein
MSEFAEERERDGRPPEGESAREETARSPFRLPLDMPRPGTTRESRVLGRAVSVAVHLLIVLAMLLPALLSPRVRSALLTGGGGAGPAGGGGGRGGVTGSREKVRYLQVAPEPAAQTPAPVTPPVITPPKPQAVQPVPPAIQPQATPPPQTTTAPPTGAASGTGDASGTGGAGPGSGGGIGSGVGTGTGSSTGPGTGGGGDTLSPFPPQPVQVFLPPSPIPAKVRGYTLVVQFEVDSTGKVLDMDFNETRDGGYNRKLRDALAKIRFRPAVKRDGTPIRARTQIEYLL